MASRIQPSETAFREPRKQRSPRKKEGAHLAFVASLPCLICNRRGCHAAHIRYPDATYWKRAVGIAEKPDDKWTVPLCPEHHTNGSEAQHHFNEYFWWRIRGIDPLAVATQLYVWSGDEEIGEEIIRKVRGNP